MTIGRWDLSDPANIFTRSDSTNIFSPPQAFWKLKMDHGHRHGNLQKDLEEIVGHYRGEHAEKDTGIPGEASHELCQHEDEEPRNRT
jgi:hypothetical protein